MAGGVATTTSEVSLTERASDARTSLFSGRSAADKALLEKNQLSVVQSAPWPIIVHLSTTMMTQPRIGKFLKDKRERVSLGLRECARTAEVRHSHLGLIESGKVTPSVPTILKLAGAIRGAGSSMSILQEIFELAQPSLSDPSSSSALSLLHSELAEIILSKTLEEAGLKIRSCNSATAGPDFFVDVADDCIIGVEVKYYRDAKDAEKAKK